MTTFKGSNKNNMISSTMMMMLINTYHKYYTTSSRTVHRIPHCQLKGNTETNTSKKTSQDPNIEPLGTDFSPVPLMPVAPEENMPGTIQEIRVAIILLFDPARQTMAQSKIWIHPIFALSIYSLDLLVLQRPALLVLQRPANHYSSSD
jgi:hypothetical protein